MDPQTQQAAEHVEGILGIPTGTFAALIMLGMAAQPVLRRLAFLSPFVRGLFEPQGYAALQQEVVAVTAAVTRLTEAVDRLCSRVLTLETERQAREDEERITAEVERRVKAAQQ